MFCVVTPCASDDLGTLRARLEPRQPAGETMIRNPQFLALVRHGQSEANVAIQRETDALYYEIPGSDTSVALTGQGNREAFDAGCRLSSMLPANTGFDTLFLSPFVRVRQSADELERGLGYAPPRIEDTRLEKRSYGDFWNLTYRGVQQLHPAEYARFQQQGHLLYRPPGGENYPDVFTRVEQFIEEQVNPSSGNLLVVTHSVVVLSFQRVFDGLPDAEVLRRYETVALPNGHIVLYSRRTPGEAWRPVYLPLPEQVA